MTVRRQLPWPLRWVLAALMLGFSGALALWAFETGKSLAGLDGSARAELAKLRTEVAALQADRDRSQSIADTADSLLKTERAAQDRLATELRQVELENQSLKADLSFFERLLPAAAGEGLAVRGFHAEAVGPGQIRYQLLVMQSGKSPSEFRGRYEIILSGSLDGRPWTQRSPDAAKSLVVRHYARVEGVLPYKAEAQVRTVQVQLLDPAGAVRAGQTLQL